MKFGKLAFLSTVLGWLCGCPQAAVTREVVTASKVVAKQAVAPRLVTIEPHAVHRFVHSTARSELYARIRVRVDHARRDKPTPVNLALVVDTSGSMEGEAIVQAKKACATMVDALADGDRLAIVTFDSRAQVLAPSTQLDKTTRADVHAAIDRIRARGTTNMADGLSQGLEQVRAHQNSQNLSRIVLVGDGVPNDPSTILATAQAAASQKIAITTLGLGVDYDETLMGRIAEAGGGKFHYVAEPEQVALVFQQEVLRMQRIAGRDATLRLALGPNVEIREVVGYTVQQSGHDRYIAIGDLVEGEDREFAVKVAVPARAAGAAIELFDVEVSYQDAVVDGGRVSAEGFLAVRASDDPEELKTGYDRAIDRSTAHASVSSLILQAIATARTGRLDDARKLVDQAEIIARDRGKGLADDGLTARTADLKKLRDSLPALVPPQPVATHGLGGRHVEPPTRPEPALLPFPAPEAARTVREVHAAAQRDLH